MVAYVSLAFGGLTVLAKTERGPLCNCHVNWEQAIFSAADKPHYRYVLFDTTDGFHVCSKKFRDFSVAHGLTGIEFVPLENGYFVLRVARLVDYHLTTAEILREGWCAACRNQRRCLKRCISYSIVPEEAPIGELEVVQSCIRWGVEIVSMPTIAQHPDLIVGDGTAQVINGAKFHEVDCIPSGLP